LSNLDAARSVIQEQARVLAQLRWEQGFQKYQSLCLFGTGQGYWHSSGENKISLNTDENRASKNIKRGVIYGKARVRSFSVHMKLPIRLLSIQVDLVTLIRLKLTLCRL
jgi:hypothetical protein